MNKQQRESQEQKQQDIQTQQVRIDFSFKREVFFIVAGALLGGIAMAFPLTFLSVGTDIHNIHTGYYLTWVVFGHIVGVHSPITVTIMAGFIIHFLTATCIGIVAGVFLYKTNILNISKPSNGLRFGLLVGIIVYLLFAIPVEQVVLNQEFRRVTQSSEQTTAISTNNKNKNSNLPLYEFQVRSAITTIMMHLLFGITLGLFSSFLSIKFGARYLCPKHCEVSFSRIDTLQNHLKFIHGDNPIRNTKTILILGGGFGGVGVLNKLQHRYQTDATVDIVIVSKDNYLLFTPMLHEIASGTIETRHIVTPIRTFCNRSRFYCASVENIDLEKKRIKIRSSFASSVQQHGLAICNSIDSAEIDSNYLRYDYLVIAVGSDTKFFGLLDVQQHAFTIKSLNDAIKLRNHIIYLLEQADQLLPQYNYDKTNKYIEVQELLLTFVVVGGGFAGVETAGELNDFIRDSIEESYHNIDKKNVRVIVVQSGNRLLPEMTEELAEFALKKLLKNGVEVILNSRVIGATENSVKLKDKSDIPTRTIIWSGGVAPSSLVSTLACERDNGNGRIIVDNYLEIPKFKGVYALGDCAFITDPNSGNPYPPTAQHAIREAAVVAKNIIAEIEGKRDEKVVFDYKTKGLMASIGKRAGVGNLLGIQVQGFLAWWIWRSYYLANLPTLHKKIRVLADWVTDLFFRRDVTMLKTFAEEKQEY